MSSLFHTTCFLIFPLSCDISSLSSSQCRIKLCLGNRLSCILISHYDYIGKNNAMQNLLPTNLDYMICNIILYTIIFPESLRTQIIFVYLPNVSCLPRRDSLLCFLPPHHPNCPLLNYLQSSVVRLCCLSYPSCLPI